MPPNIIPGESSEACQSKDVSTEVDRQGGRGLPKETPVQISELSKEISCIPHVSSAENVGHFKNMRRECQVKNFDGLGPFSCVCRMIHFSEPNTNQSQIETGVEGVEQEEDFSSAYCESSVGDQHYVCVVNPERVRGFPVEINLEEGENDADENVFDDDLDSGAVPTTPPKSDQGSDREPSEWHQVRMIRMNRTIWGVRIRTIRINAIFPNLKGIFCISMSAKATGLMTRVVMPVCRQEDEHQRGVGKQKSEESGQTAEFQLAADYTFIAGRHWRLLVMLMIHTGMLGIVVVTGNKENDVKSVASVLNEIGVGGLNIEVATDNERYLIDLMSKGLAKSNARAYHWRNISEYRPQAKGVERAVCIAKEGIYTNWLAFEVHCQCRIYSSFYTASYGLSTRLPLPLLCS